ncbi:AMP-binding protein [Paraneptunicella aestuarii]|uniref:AMP-binding protein n=1 Tax=Paraneptunicella aestuarii TaxID=2831148 RepID=UPI001E6556A2|nr:AMP-binding protein [Paraneptunicella aestuarii]UAA39502.1 AMP-binding protein [Paraneptunicella aestuarii]
MPEFYNDLQRFDDSPAIKVLQDDGAIAALSYSELERRCNDFSQQLPQTRGLCFVLVDNSPASLIAYLSCLRSQHIAILLDANISEEQLNGLQQTYHPDCLIQGGNITRFENLEVLQAPRQFDKRIAVMLSTSGSTGSPKQVALSATNLQANAQSICQYLPIHQADTTITTLPFNYSYGLSIINSHLLTGACIFMGNVSVVDRQFWDILDKAEITSFGGVPYSYEMLLRLGLTKQELPFLRYFTQAGGKLQAKRVKVLNDYAQAHHKKFFVMYGQTEATARMAYVEPDVLANKPETIGKAIPGGRLTLVNEQGDEISEPNKQGELVYRGDNVMLGYVESEADLKQITPLQQLHTGDLAYFDEDGDFFIVGRLKRFIKVFGLRISLDEVEQMLRKAGIDCYVVGEDNQIQLAVTHTALDDNKLDEKALIKQVSTQLHIHHSTVKVKAVEELPVTANGKADYQAVTRLFNGSSLKIR